jgi:chromate transporter
MSAGDWAQLALFHLSVSLLAVGGAVTLVPDLFRYAVMEHGLLSAAQFKQALVLAQAAPGPNVLYVALLGWQIGQNAAGASPLLATWVGAAGACIALASVLLPSSVLALLLARWLERHASLLGIQVFRQGMAPLVIGLMAAGAWLLLQGGQGLDPRLAALAALVAALVWRTRLHLLWMLAAGALLGALGWV